MDIEVVGGGWWQQLPKIEDLQTQTTCTLKLIVLFTKFTAQDAKTLGVSLQERFQGGIRTQLCSKVREFS